MQKTTEFVKAKGTTIFFPKIIVTEEEMERLCHSGQIDLYWVRLVVSNYTDFGDMAIKRKLPDTRSALYEQLVKEWSNNPDEIIYDIQSFANGDFDLIDLVVKYGVGYKQCRKFFKDVLCMADRVIDVDSYWKAHKKHAQKNTTVSLYGVEHTAMRKEVQEKRRITNRERYGADNPMQCVFRIMSCFDFPLLLAKHG